MVINDKGGCKGKKIARKHLTKGKNELRLSHSSNEKYAIVKKLLVMSGGGVVNKNVKYCDLLEVYNSSERDILRRTHGVFDNFKDDSITGKYDDYGSSSIAFIDQNTLKYQEMVKKMEKKDGGNGAGSGSDDDNQDGICNEQSIVITTNVKHIGKGVISQSYDISDSDNDSVSIKEEEEEEEEKYQNEPKNKNNTHNHYKKFEYTQENIVDIDDI